MTSVSVMLMAETLENISGHSVSRCYVDGGIERNGLSRTTYQAFLARIPGSGSLERVCSDQNNTFGEREDTVVQFNEDDTLANR